MGTRIPANKWIDQFLESSFWIVRNPSLPSGVKIHSPFILQIAPMSWFQNHSGTQQAKHPLAKSALLAGLSGSELSIVQSFMHERRYLPGEVIFDEGDEGQALYFVLAGRAVICHQGRMADPIAELNEGNFFGELALLDNWPRSAQARAVDDTDLAVLFRGDFERLMVSHAGIASKISMQLARHLGQRLRGMLARQQPESSPV